MTNRSSNEAGLDGLSAFCVASSNSSLDEWGDSSRAVDAISRCAAVGGLKEESRMNKDRAGRRSWDSVGTRSRISNVRGEAMNSLSEEAYRARRILSELFAMLTNVRAEGRVYESVCSPGDGEDDDDDDDKLSTRVGGMVSHISDWIRNAECGLISAYRR